MSRSPRKKRFVIGLFLSLSPSSLSPSFLDMEQKRRRLFSPGKYKRRRGFTFFSRDVEFFGQDRYFLVENSISRAYSCQLNGYSWQVHWDWDLSLFLSFFFFFIYFFESKIATETEEFTSGVKIGLR